MQKHNDAIGRKSKIQRNWIECYAFAATEEIGITYKLA